MSGIISRNTRVQFAFMALLLGCIPFVSGFQKPERPKLPNIDKRIEQANAGIAPLPPGKQVALERLRQNLPQVQIDFEPVTGSPKLIRATDGFLTGRKGQGRGVSAQDTAGIPANDPNRGLKAFLRRHRELFGHGPEILEKLKLQRDFVVPHNGMRTTIWEQELDGIPIFEAVLISHTTKQGELVQLSCALPADAAGAAENGIGNRATAIARPKITARRAVRLAAQNVGEVLEETDVTLDLQPNPGATKAQKASAPVLKGEADVHLIWVPVSADKMRLCWDIIFTSRSRGEMFRVLIDTQTGECWVRYCLTQYLSDASFRVYTSDSPSPFSPGHPTPLSTQPVLVDRNLLTLSALNTNASPNGWIDDGVNETIGNNVQAQLDRNADNMPDLPRPSGSPFRVFDFPMDLNTQDPTNYSSAAVAQLFYTCNWMHDRLYELGFNEASGNFQVTNFTRGGLGNDPLQADAQDGEGANNANMSTPPDGLAPRLQMFLFTRPSPRRDGDFDAEIVLHEYTHGLSNRRVGGGVGLSAIQSEGLGEGWSDFYALALLSEAADNINGNYAKGAYVTYLVIPGFTQNYYYGIRRYPYSTDMTKNPLTFKDIDPAQASPHSGVPLSPWFAPFNSNAAGEVHNQGEVWCAALWEARANLIAKYGFETGNRLSLQLVTDGMNLSPANPNFLQARDAIIQADRVNSGGANFRELWTAFAKRGMGFSAGSPWSSTIVGVREAFDLPDDLQISPLHDIVTRGPVGGPFSLNGGTYYLTNIGSTAFGWSLISTSAWLDVGPSSGTVSPGGGTKSVSVVLNSNAYTLPMGLHNATLLFSNQATANVQMRTFALHIGLPDYFTEWFQGKTNDLAFQSWTFTPDGSQSYYSVCRATITNFYTEPGGGTNVYMTDDSSMQVILSSNATVALYGRRTNTFFIASNGYITFNQGDDQYNESFYYHFLVPRIAALFDDLNPSGGGTISWKELTNRVAVTWLNVPEYGVPDGSSFQIELFFDGRIRVSYLNVTARDGLAGLSNGQGIPSDFDETDLTGFGLCGATLFLSLPANATEGEGVLTNLGNLMLSMRLSSNLVVELACSNTNEVSVPPTVLIPAGETNAVFNVSILDDALLDGTQTALINASAPGLNGGQASVRVLDNETATLHLAVPAFVTEGDTNVLAQLTLSASPDAEVFVSLHSTLETELRLPPGVLLPAGQTSAVFTLTVNDDGLINGSRNASIVAHVPNWVDGVAGLVVHDNESLALHIILPQSAGEGDGILTNAGQVQISGLLPTNLVVNLASGEPSELTVPTNVTILTGQITANFNVTIIEDALLDSNRTVFVTVSAPGFSNGVSSILVRDDEIPRSPTLPSPPHLATNIPFNISLSWTGDSANTSNEVYFGFTPNLGSGNLLGVTTNTSWPLPLLPPNTTCYWQIVSRRLGTFTGAVWQFTTRGADHFHWNAIAPAQILGQSFSASITARDELDRQVTNFTGPVTLSALSAPFGSGTFHESFEGGATNPWVLGTNFTICAITNDTAAEGQHSLTLRGGQNFHYQGVSYALGNVQASRVTFAVRASETNRPGGYFVAGTGPAITSNAVFFLMNSDGKMGLAEDIGGFHAIPYEANRWYKVSLVFDWETQKVDYYVDDQLKFAGIRFRANVPHLSMLYLYNASGTQAWWDEIEILPRAERGAIVGLAPLNSGEFVNGIWTGSITITQPGTNIYLVARDTQNHFGASATFTANTFNDLAVTMQSTPNPVDVGGLLTYSVALTNTGPAPATQVILSNKLPQNVTLTSVSTSQGACTNDAGNIRCELGQLDAQAYATVSITLIPSATGWLTNVVTVSRAEIETYTANDSALAITEVRRPAVIIVGTILEEGDLGFTNAVFEVRLSTPTQFPVTVSYATTNGSATPGIDFIPTNGVLLFSPGQTTQTISVLVMGDVSLESNELFFINLGNPTNAVLANAQATGTILNDDGLPGKIDHFAWTTVPSPQVVNGAFPVSIAALDSFNNPATNFSGSVGLSTSTSAALTPTNLLRNPSVQNSGRGSSFYTDGYSFTPTNNILVTHVRHIGGSKVSVWTDSGKLVISQPVVSVPGTWMETSIGAPVELLAGNTYRIGALWTNWYFATNLGQTFANGTIHQSYYGNGDSFPNTSQDWRWPFVDLSYIVSGAPGPGIAPTNTGPFVAGVWSGFLTVASAATNLVVQAKDAPGHSGLTNPFHVSEPNQPPILLTQPLSLTLDPGASGLLEVSVFGTPPLFQQWRLDGQDLPGATNAFLLLTNFLEEQAGVYSVRVWNNFGTVTSSNAIVTLHVPLTLPNALNAPGLTWTTGGSSPWFPQTNISHDGSAAQSGIITDQQQSWLQTTIVGPGTLSFWWKVSSEAGYDFLNFYTNGVQVQSITGEEDWQRLSFDMPAGSHTIRWNYLKDESAFDGQDRGWVDQVGLSDPSLEPPGIVSQPGDQTVAIGATANFTVVTTGSSPLLYQWFLNTNTPISGATNSFLMLTNVQLSAVGFYHVVVSNFAVVTSRVARLNVVPPPVITLNPQSQTVAVGENVSFAAGADGEFPMSYRWRQGTLELTNVSAYSNTCFFVISNVTLESAGTYLANITNVGGLATGGAGLGNTLDAHLVVVIPPTNQAGPVGSRVSFHAQVSSNALGYKWQFNGQTLPATGDPNLVLTNIQCALAGTYTLLVTNPAGFHTAFNAILTVIDTEPPVVVCPTNLFLSWPGTNGTQAFFTPTAHDNCASNLVVNCIPPSGSVFPLGTNLVTCWAGDLAGNTNSCTFAVTILDTEPPALTCPRDELLDYAGTNGTQVNFSAQATDNLDTNVVVSCSPPSGSFFPLGTNVVVCTASDTAANTNSCAFSIIVLDTAPPVINCPENQLLTCMGSNGASATFNAIASDNVDGLIVATCMPPSDSYFPVGTNLVTCQAVDSSGNSNQCSFTITVLDTQPPLLTCPSNQVLACTGPYGAQAFYSPGALDTCSGKTIVVCEPPSGSFFPPGTNLVTCWSADGAGNTNECAFTVAVVELTGPQLSIIRDAANVSIRWPASCRTYRLQFTPGLTPVEWTTVPEAPILSDNYYTVTLPLTTESRFYRLQE